MKEMRTRVVNKSLGLIAMLALVALAPAAKATPIYSCGDASACNGNEYALVVDSLGGNTFQLTLDIHVLGTYTGTKWTDLVNSVEIKDFTSGTLSNISLVSAPGGLSLWNNPVGNELNANGCAGGSAGNRLCVEAKSPSLGAAFTVGDVLAWTFQFDSTADVGTTTHIKYRYVSAKGKKVGSLGSWDITDQGKGKQPPVPEPVSATLVGVGLLSLGCFFRRKTR
jgi:hypothetical protein